MTTPTPEPPSDPPTNAPGAQTPGERRLSHPPSDRYRAPADGPPSIGEGASAARGLAYGAAATVAAVAATIVLGGVFAMSAGLLVVAAVTGWAVAVGLRIGGGSQLARPRRVRLALVLATAGVFLGQLGLWLFARYEGGVLGPVDYLAETFGLLIPLQLAVAWIVAAAAARRATTAR